MNRTRSGQRLSGMPRPNPTRARGRMSLLRVRRYFGRRAVPKGTKARLRRAAQIKAPRDRAEHHSSVRENRQASWRRVLHIRNGRSPQERLHPEAAGQAEDQRHSSFSLIGMCPSFLLLHHHSGLPVREIGIRTLPYRRISGFASGPEISGKYGR